VRVPPISPEWITAIATVVYTIGTLFLWWVTRQSLEATRDLFRLTLLLEYYKAQEPVPNVGHPWETREVPQGIEELRKKQLEAMRRAFDKGDLP
jgi:hypothetical protein